MTCPCCEARTYVYARYDAKPGVRYRKCPGCGVRFTTEERRCGKIRMPKAGLQPSPEPALSAAGR